MLLSPATARDTNPSGQQFYVFGKAISQSECGNNRASAMTVGLADLEILVSAVHRGRSWQKTYGSSIEEAYVSFTAKKNLSNFV